MSKIVIGLVGEIGGGKGTVVEIFKDLLPHKDIEILKFSGILAEVLDTLHLEKTRHNFQQLAINIDDMFGEGTFANAMKQRVVASDADLVFVDGIRWLPDEEMIRDVNGVLIYVTADQKTRYTRITSRGEKIGEQDTTFEEFQQQELMKNETFIKDIGSRADYTITNEGSQKDLEETVKTILEKIIQ